MNKRGFTLIELLVVIAILGMLMAILVAVLDIPGRLNEATEAKARTNVQQIATAMEACITKNSGSEASCSTWALLYGGGFVKTATAPSGVSIAAGCVSAVEASSQYCKFTTGTGVTACDQASGC